MFFFVKKKTKQKTKTCSSLCAEVAISWQHAGWHVVAPLPLVPLGTRCLDFRTMENAGQDLMRVVITHDMVIHISALDKTTPHVTLMITMSALAKAMLILCTCYLQVSVGSGWKENQCSCRINPRNSIKIDKHRKMSQKKGKQCKN